MNTFRLFSHIPFFDKLLFTKHFSIMIKTGIPIAEILQSLGDQVKSKHFRSIISHVLRDVQNGQPLATAFGKYPEAFSTLYVSLIAVGEESGNLEQTFGFLSKQLEKEYSLHKKIEGASLYPAIILITMTILSGFIAIFILPKIIELFKGFNTTLPPTTKALLFVANLMKNHGLLIISGIIVGFITFILLIQTKTCKPWWHRFILHLPVVGSLIANIQRARFARNLGVLLQSGVPINKSLTVAASTLTNIPFQRHILFVAHEVVKGKTLADSLSQHNGRFLYSSLTIKMVQVGEKSGKLEETLLYLGDFYEEEVDTVAKNFATVIEPVLLLGIGLLVAFVSLAIISPIYEFIGSVGG
ncbi:type II secretion system F family protein [Candidatus Roizmanbacteria bacterium]|nr:type II secretion system F family protein [Candidatus Roizmanbacteria bacterium]